MYILLFSTMMGVYYIQAIYILQLYVQMLTQLNFPRHRWMRSTVEY